MATSLNLTELEQGATYEFQVIAKGNGTTYDDSDASTTVSWTTKTKLATPVVTTSKDTSSFTASWGAIANATSYVLEYKLSTASTYQSTTVAAPTVTKKITGLTSGSTYNVRVKAVSTNTSYVDSDYSTVANVVISTQLDTPAPTYSSTVNSITATWSKITNASSYKVYYKKSTASSYTSETVTGTTWTKSSLTSGDVYSVYVQAIGSGDYTNSANSTATNVTVKTKLTAPTGLAVARTTKSLTLTWTAVANKSSYKVYYKKGSGSYQSTTKTSESFELTGLSEGDTYTFYVVAVGTGNYVDSANSATISGTTKITLATPTGLTASDVLSTTATLSWNTVSNASGYSLTISDANGPITGYNGKSITGTNASLTGLTATREYTVSLVAKTGSDDYVDSAAATLVFTTDTKLGTPAAPTVTAKTISSISVSWGAISAADSYVLAYKLSTATSFTEVPITNGRTYTLSSLDQGKTYTFKVRAVTTNDAYENGEFSPTVSATTLIKLDAPDGLNVTNITLAESTLNWNAVTHASGYIVKWRKSGATTWNTQEVEG